MTINRRHVLTGAIAAPAVIAAARLGFAAPAQMLKISHQFPGGTIDEGDFRDRICLKFAAELEKRTNGELGGQVYPNSSLMKTVPQFSALRRGALDLSFYPISYAGGEIAGDQYRPDARPGEQLQARRRLEDCGGREEIRRVSRRARTSSSCHGSGRLAGWRAAPIRSSIPADAKGQENPRRQPRDGHDAAGGRRHDAVDALERALRRDADRRLRCRADLIDQPDLVPAGGSRQEPHHRPRQILLVHARAADHVEADLRQAAARSNRT